VYPSIYLYLYLPESTYILSTYLSPLAVRQQTMLSFSLAFGSPVNRAAPLVEIYSAATGGVAYGNVAT
jgi:hypothetical protein